MIDLSADCRGMFKNQTIWKIPSKNVWWGVSFFGSENNVLIIFARKRFQKTEQEKHKIATKNCIYFEEQLEHSGFRADTRTHVY